jgi:hypothetical protein
MLCGYFPKLGEIAKIADAPVARRAQQRELYRDTPQS